MRPQQLPEPNTTKLCTGSAAVVLPDTLPHEIPAVPGGTVFAACTPASFQLIPTGLHIASFHTKPVQLRSNNAFSTVEWLFCSTPSELQTDRRLASTIGVPFPCWKN